MDGGWGVDSLDGGAGNDTLVFESSFSAAHDSLLFSPAAIFRPSLLTSPTGVTVDLAAQSAINSEGRAEVVRNFEHVIGTLRGDRLTGSAIRNSLTGAAGNDTLNGGEGADILTGGAGLDVLTGGAGKDRFVLDLSAGSMDTITDFTFGADALQIPSAGKPVNQINIGGTLAVLNTVGADIVVSTVQGAPFLTLQNGVAAMIRHLAGDIAETSGADIGTEGDDTLQGGGGRDKLVGFGGRDLIAGLGGDDDLSGGDGNDAVSGGNGDDTLSGDAGRDTLSGGGGADRLMGGEGADRLSGGSAADTLDGGAGQDRLTGGTGRDTFVLANDGSGPDTLTDFKLRDDVIDLSSFAQIGIVPKLADLRALAVGRRRALADHAGRSAEFP